MKKIVAGWRLQGKENIVLSLHIKERKFNEWIWEIRISIQKNIIASKNLERKRSIEGDIDDSYIVVTGLINRLPKCDCR